MINLVKFNKEKLDHLCLLKDLYKMEDIKSNVRTILNINSMSYVIEDEKCLGILKLNKELNNNYSFDMALLPEYQNKGYGTRTMNLVTRLLQDNWDTIIIRTDYNNKKAIKAAYNSGFVIDNLEMENNEKEGKEYLILTKTNKKKA